MLSQGLIEKIQTVVDAIQTAANTGEAISDPRAQTIAAAGLSAASLIKPAGDGVIASLYPQYVGIGATLLGVLNTAKHRGQVLQ